MNISFTPAFKLAAVKAYKLEKRLEDGFDLDILSSRKPKESLKRWRSFTPLMANLEERRGKGSSGRPYSKEL